MSAFHITRTYSARRQPSFASLVAPAAALLLACVSPLVARAADGDLDTSFGSTGEDRGANGTVTAITVKPDGKILIGGSFSGYDGVLRNSVAQLNTDGSLDTSFDPRAGIIPYQTVIDVLTVQPDGKVLIGGAFDYYDGVQRTALVRVNANGSLDTTFNTGNSGFNNGYVHAIVLQADGKILVAGRFFEYNGVTRRLIMRLNADGSLDGSFNDSGIDGNDIFAIGLQSDGKIMIGGSFSWASGGAIRFNLARLNSNGSRDTSFDPGGGPDSAVRALVLQQDGKVVIGGDFLNYYSDYQNFIGVARSGIARVNTGGTVDTTFDPGTGLSRYDSTPVFRMASQPDGKIVVAGYFYSYNDVGRRSIVRINVDASVDPTFTSDTDVNNSAYYRALALQPDGKMIIGGTFNFYKGIQRNNLARLLSASPLPPDPGPPLAAPTNFTVNDSASGFAVQPDSVLRMRVTQPSNAARLIVRVQSSTTPANEGSWTDLNNGSFGRMIFDVTNGTYVLNTTTYPRLTNLYFRTISTAPGNASSTSYTVGPFHLTSSAQHLGRTVLSTTRNGVGAKINFRAFDETHPSGVSMRVQTASSPGDEGNWADLADGNGGKMAAYGKPGNFFLDSKNYPPHGALYFRVVASAPGYVDSPSRGVGPFHLINSPSPNVTVTSPASSGGEDGDEFQDPVVLPFAPFTIAANASPNGGPAIKSVGLIYDGETIQRFNAANGSRSFKPAAPGDHVIEAFAFDEVGVTGHAIPIYVRIAPAAGKIYNRVADGDWNDAARWLDQALQNGVPGPNDFASISSYNVSLSQDVTVLAAALHGGSINGPGALTITGTFTVSAGTLPIPSLTIGNNGTLLLANETAIGMASTLTNYGTVRLIGGAGITGLNASGTTAAADSVRGFDLGAAIRNIGRWLMGPRSGGKREAAQPTREVPVVVEVATFANEGGQVLGQDVAGIIANDGASIISNDGASIISNDGASIISNDGASIISNDGASIVSGGGGNIIAGGGGNIAQPKQSRTDAATAVGGYLQIGGTTNLSGIRLTGPVRMSGGILTGNGLIEGDLMNDGGDVAPGNLTGSIAVTGSFSQGANGALLLEVGGTNAAAHEFDQLKIGGSAAFGGLLSIRTINGFTPDPSVPLVPLSYASATGDFASTSGNVQIDLRDTGANLAVAGPNPPTPVITAAVSRKTHSNGAPLDVNLPLTGTLGVEPRRSTPDGAHQIVLTFSEPVTIDGASITAGGGSVASYTVNGATVTLNLTGVLNAQLVRLSLTSVSNGVTLVNPSISFGLLVGDANGDGTVNSGDATGTRSRSGQGADTSNARYDVTTDGTINAGDATVVRSRSGDMISR